MLELNLPWGNVTFSLSHAHTNTHTVEDVLTFPDRHLSLSLCGCKVSSLQPSLPRNNKCAHSVSHLPDSRNCSSEVGQQGQISPCGDGGQGEKNQHCPQNMSPLHCCSTNTGLQPLYDSTNSQCFQLHVRELLGVIELPSGRRKKS